MNQSRRIKPYWIEYRGRLSLRVILLQIRAARRWIVRRRAGTQT